MEQHTAEVWVKVFAILSWVGAAAALLVGLLFIIGGPIAGSLLKDQAEVLGGLVSALGIVLGVILLGAAVLNFFIGRGLWLHQNWARIVVLVFAWIGAVGGVLGIIGAFFSNQVALNLLQNLISLGIAGFEIWLFQYEPTVKELFLPKPAAKTAAKAKR